MKRFWSNATPVETGGLYGVLLDSRAVKLPSGAEMTVPYKKLAAAIAQEWAVAKAEFSPNDLPLTQLVCTAQERVAPHRAEIIAQLAAYGLNDLLCYRADSPPTLVARQHEEWDPWLRWLDSAHGIGLITTNGLMPVNQLPWTAGKLDSLLAARSDYELAALGVLIPVLGSFVLGLATAEGLLLPETACAAASLDELWQTEQWGEDEEDSLKRGKILAEVEDAIRFLRLVAP
ncbi:ATP12 family chaperone protein [Acidocella aminolytica]|jgi:chaperone required for assembly of F1-ATPase|uniref:ATP synthase F1 mitochondrial assembly chaperone ATP12 n=1 Tax=Acidocella aminolytica 101 = DSM 11237 TaxID=1120923 RepID=A0A0D6PEV4_9PROT|nr:ATP12 family protein [Acidocella aminolytica]GAN79733.1 ATP synthase F1 mitochondrial assembly chaperone ATP12 [Acidocella aminolytica 101 = DSM 11237]GBQ39883.1 ATP12 chaperone protein [Acidocella aminolytica 101 = DSM 11237]SHE72467.1 Chaperone required for the assembly of the F1-ATPase [Acidocella aminolytica 101 = DSM 11237]